MKFFVPAVLLCFSLFSCSNPPSPTDNSPTDNVAEAVLQNGRDIFHSRCASCHMINKELTGPALKGVESRWPDKQKLYAFVRNSQEVIKNDKYAHDLWLEYNQTVMVPHPDLSDSSIQSILYYIKSVSEK